jgi:hypothetical protein
MAEAPSPSLRGRLGALSLHAKYDPRETTANGRAMFLGRFDREVDPEGILPPEERARRAAFAKRAYFVRLAMKSAKARAKKRGKL